MKSQPHVRLLPVLAFALLCTSALALAPRLVFGLAFPGAQVWQAPAPPHLALGRAQSVRASQGPQPTRALCAVPERTHIACAKVVHVRLLRAERRARVEQAPVQSRRMLLPQFVLQQDAPLEHGLVDLRADRLQLDPGRPLSCPVPEAHTKRSPLLALLERPPRA